MTLAGARDGDAAKRREAAVHFAECYWKPVYVYLRGFGHDRLRAEDLTQEFFARFFAKNALAKADAARGRFRNFLLGSLTNFLRNEYRDSRTEKRIPVEQITSLHAVIEQDGTALTPRDHETPEAAFHRTWTMELVVRVLSALEREFIGNLKQDHLEIFRRFLVEPALCGSEQPTYANLAARFCISEVKVGFRITTARRAFRRLLRAEIRSFAHSEAEVEAEIEALFVFLAKR